MWLAAAEVSSEMPVNNSIQNRIIEMNYKFSFKEIALVGVLLIATKAGFSQVSQTIGTIPSADSIVVYHDVTINTTSLPAGFNRIASRGTVAGTGFSVLTDDPDTVPADSTITDVNMPPVFAGGASQPFSICRNASAQSMNSLLTASHATRAPPPPR